MLEVRESHVLVLKARHHVIVPDDRHMTSTRSVGAADHPAGKVGALDRSLNDELLSGTQGDTLLDQQFCVLVNLARESVDGGVGFCWAHGQLHGGSFWSCADGQSMRARPLVHDLWPNSQRKGPRRARMVPGAGNGIRTREYQLGKLGPYHLAMPAC